MHAFHLNDSKTGFASKRDLHANIGEGEIGIEFFNQLMNDERFGIIPKLLELPDRDNDLDANIKLLRSLYLLISRIRKN